MTFKEKYLQEHPEEADTIDSVIAANCPDRIGYEAHQEICPVDLQAAIEKNDNSCVLCWNREMPKNKEDGAVSKCSVWIPKYNNEGKLYVSTDCGACNERLKTDIFGLDEWEEYRRDRYKPKLTNYCPHCGTKIIAPKEITYEK